MIRLKSQEDIKILEEGGKILASIIDNLSRAVKPGVSTAVLEKEARRLAQEKDAQCSFLGYSAGGNLDPYPAALCASINDEIVHAMGHLDRVLKQGDIISLDMGLKYKGLFTDMAITIPVGSISKEAARLIQVTRKSLMCGIEAIKPGGNLSDIGEAIQEYVESHNMGVVRELVGHGVGYAVHEEPSVPNYKMSRQVPIKLEEGLVIAIEPMVTLGGWRIKFDTDGWTARTKDGSLSAHFEHTIAVTRDGYKILTAL